MSQFIIRLPYCVSTYLFPITLIMHLLNGFLAPFHPCSPPPKGQTGKIAADDTLFDQRNKLTPIQTLELHQRSASPGCALACSPHSRQDDAHTVMG